MAWRGTKKAPLHARHQLLLRIKGARRCRTTLRGLEEKKKVPEEDLSFPHEKRNTDL
eukprot:CAMPEP_0206472050 /NCGR_PEP_ID=MMETSP0324_2-20121206/31948_1 /ASSEMBLY_ACC=CAM_ASM_000836 /TAXON_ID=2866 /ORGANISM="Crypthecodinium cohnii, Strain Seligo" /LENGTH=56 /DNA_ID=CAMNT_0053946533 /DNA_START=188 /DNA_END=358 /DNA_ORIENTATION=-